MKGGAVKKIMVANRGEIACRILRTLREMNIPSVALYTDLDADAPHVWLADEAVGLGAPEKYLDSAAILSAARATGTTAIHPGYGFLSQNPQFARDCAAAGVTFIGPSPEAMASLGDKRAARDVAEANQVPVVPGAQSCDTVADARRAAMAVGFPILLKAAGGGGGKGMRRVDNVDALDAAFAAAEREARGAFADARLLVEKYIHPARHIEVQILGDGKRAIAFGERECSLQRRYQKIIEEAPSPSLTPQLRTALCAAAVRLVEAAGYASAGTVEFLVDPHGKFYFLEVNTRLQVEHPVTEMIWGIDLVRAQIEVAHGAALPTLGTPRGHAIEARLNAEDVPHGFLPATGRVLFLDWPQRPCLRVDAGIHQGSVVSPHYDPMLAKIIAWAPDRATAQARLIAGLRDLTLLGVVTNQSFLIDVLQSDFFSEAATYTDTIEAHSWPGTEAPAVVVTAAQLAPSVGTSEAGGQANSDPHSPWHSLGAFRVGACG